jgi:hypothetical protein
MKNVKIMFVAIVATLLMSVSFAHAQVVIRERLVAPGVVVERPAAPGPHHIWVEGEWRWSKHDGRYVWAGGYWLKERPGHEWVPGHWAEVPGGVRWEVGHWRRL